MESTSANKGDVLPPTLPHIQIRLDGSNFLLWKTLILPSLSGLNLHGFLDGTNAAPKKHTTNEDGSDVPDPAYQIWWQQDQRVLGVLLNSMSSEIATQMVGLTSAAQVWSAVHAMFAAQNRATIRHTRLQLQTMKKKDLTAADYFGKMKALGDTMASIGAPLTTDELIDYILAGLGPQYSPLAASLTIINKDVSLADFYAYLLSFESMQEQQTRSDDRTSSANTAARQSDPSGRRSPPRPDSQNNCDRRGSRSRSSFQHGNGPHGNRGGGGRGRNSGGRFRPKCQICRLFGHDALNCHNRFNEAYNSDAPRSGNAVDRRSSGAAPWYMDSGATDHLTSDLDRLTIQEKYPGNDQVQVANGTDHLICDACQRAKSHQLPYVSSSRVSTQPLELIHTDVWGPAISSSGGYRYYVSFIDDYSRFCWVYLIKFKSDVESVFYIFQQHVERLLNSKIRTVQSDGGGEYSHLREYFRRTGISHRVSCPYTSQQNGIAERKHRHLVETGLALLAHSSLPLRFWDEAFLTACYLINRLPSRVIHNSTPITRLLQISPDYSFLRTFGCACWPSLRKYNSHKLEFRSTMCVFLGYSSMHKGYKCLDRKTGRIYISRDVVFDENVFPFANPAHVPDFSLLTSPVTFPTNEPVIQGGPMRNYDMSLLSTNQTASEFNPFQVAPCELTTTPDVEPTAPTNDLSNNGPAQHTRDTHISPPSARVEPSTNGQPINPIPETPETLDASSPLLPPPTDQTTTPAPLSDTSAPQQDPSEGRYQTRSRSGIHLPRHFSDGTIRYDPNRRAFLATTPSSHRSALTDPVWRAAMIDELRALKRTNTWTLVPKPANTNVIGSKWVFRTKLRPDGSIATHKARLVARGFAQQFGIDYLDTFSPVVKPETIRLILAIAVSRGWTLRQIDVSNAFLHGHLEETVFMQQPPGFEDSVHPTHVCKLQRPIYGLKQSPRAWYARLSQTICKLGFTPSRADTSLFVLHGSSVIIFLLVYVDDIVITGSCADTIARIIRRLSDAFPVKDLGNLHYFLGLEVVYNSEGLILTQHKYALDLLHRVNMENCKPTSTPMSANEKLVRNSGHSLNDKDIITYRSMVGGLLYLTLTRPDISFAVNKVCQFVSKPTDEHCEAVKRILRYVKGTIETGLKYRQSSLTRLSIFTDADWAGCSDDRRSTGGFAIFFGPNLISWSAKKQPTVSRSSTEAEYKALANGTAEAIWIQSVLKELGVKQKQPPILWCDNLGATYLTANPVFHARTKHIETDFHFVRERVAQGELDVRFISTKDQLADVFTKPATRQMLDRFRPRRNHHRNHHQQRRKPSLIIQPGRVRLSSSNQSVNTQPLEIRDIKAGGCGEDPGFQRSQFVAVAVAIAFKKWTLEKLIKELSNEDGSVPEELSKLIEVDF